MIGFIHRIIINVGFIGLNRSLSAADYLLHFSSLEFLLKLLWFTFVVFKTKRVYKAHELFVKLIAGNFVGKRRITGVLVHLQKINNVVFTVIVRKYEYLTLLGFLSFLGLLAGGASC